MKKGSQKGQSKANERYAVTVRRTRVSELMLMGWGHQRIANELNVSRPTVVRDVSIINEAFRKTQTVNVGEMKRRIQAEIDVRKQQYWEGWDRSKAAKETRTAKRKGKAVKGSEPDERTIRSEDQVGDPRFLDGVGKCQDQSIELNGLAPAKQVNLNDISKRPSDQLFGLLVSRLPALAEALAGGSVAGGA